MDKSRIEEINRGLLEKTGVDFSRYRNPELVDAVGNAIVFPRYLARSLRRPVGLLLGGVLVAAILADSGYFRAFLVFPGGLIAIINGILLGLVLFVNRIRDDMVRVFEISSDLTVQALRDVGEARQRLAGSPDRFPGMLEIFHGVNSVVLLPAFVTTLERKLPLFGKWVARLAERFFAIVDRRLAAAIRNKAEAEGIEDLRTAPEDVAAWLDTAERLLGAARQQIGSVVRIVTRIVAFPFKTVFTIAALVSASILWGAWVFMG